MAGAINRIGIWALDEELYAVNNNNDF